MAIFTNAIDRDLPILTVAFQVEGDEEIAWFQERYSPGYSIVPDPPDLMPPDEAARYKPETIAYLIQGTKKSLALVRTTMEQLHKFGDLDFETAMAVKSEIKHMRDLTQRRFGPFVRNEQGRVAREYLRRPCEYDVRRDPDYRLLDALDTLIEKWCDNPNVLSRCECCDAVYVVTRTDRRFCSQRCAARVSTRRRRATGRGVAERKVASVAG